MDEFLEELGACVRFTECGRVSLYDLFKMMNITSNEKKQLQKYKACVRHHAITNLSPTLRWNKEDRSTSTIKGAKETPCADIEHTLMFLAYFLPRADNLPEKEVQRLLACFELTDVTFLPVNEKSIMSDLTAAFPWPCVTQFAIGSYRIDLYIPRFKIAIECDEFQHTAYNKIDEEERETFITEQLTCRWVRFDPYTENFSIFEVIRQVLHLVFLRHKYVKS